jgi:hypothetical protein
MKEWRIWQKERMGKEKEGDGRMDDGGFSTAPKLLALINWN